MLSAPPAASVGRIGVAVGQVEYQPPAGAEVPVDRVVDRLLLHVGEQASVLRPVVVRMQAPLDIRVQSTLTGGNPSFALT